MRLLKYVLSFLESRKVSVSDFEQFSSLDKMLFYKNAFHLRKAINFYPDDSDYYRHTKINLVEEYDEFLFRFFYIDKKIFSIVDLVKNEKNDEYTNVDSTLIDRFRLINRAYSALNLLESAEKLDSNIINSLFGISLKFCSKVELIIDEKAKNRLDKIFNLKFLSSNFPSRIFFLDRHISFSRKIQLFVSNPETQDEILIAYGLAELFSSVRLGINCDADSASLHIQGVLFDHSKRASFLLRQIVVDERRKDGFIGKRCLYCSNHIAVFSSEQFCSLKCKVEYSSNYL